MSKKSNRYNFRMKDMLKVAAFCGHSGMSEIRNSFCSSFSSDLQGNGEKEVPKWKIIRDHGTGEKKDPRPPAARLGANYNNEPRREQKKRGKNPGIYG